MLLLFSITMTPAITAITIIASCIAGIFIGSFIVRMNRFTKEQYLEYGEWNYTQGVQASINLGTAALAGYVKSYFEERTFTVLSLTNVRGHDYIVMEDKNSNGNSVIFLLRGLNILLTDEFDGKITNFKLNGNYVFRLTPFDDKQSLLAEKRKDSTLYVYKLFARKV